MSAGWVQTGQGRVSAAGRPQGLWCVDWHWHGTSPPHFFAGHAYGHPSLRLLSWLLFNTLVL